MSSIILTLAAYAAPVDDALAAVSAHLDVAGPARLRPDTVRAALVDASTSRECAPVIGGGGTYSDGVWTGDLGGLAVDGVYARGRASGVDLGAIPVPVHDVTYRRSEGAGRYAGAELSIVYIRTSGASGIWVALGGCASTRILAYGQSVSVGSNQNDGRTRLPIGPETPWPGRLQSVVTHEGDGRYIARPDLGAFSNFVGIEGKMLEDPDVTVIKTGWRGTSLDEWLSPRDLTVPRSDLMGRTLWAVDQMGCPDIAIWMHGETDSTDSRPPPVDYVKRWEAGVADPLTAACPGLLHVFPLLQLREVSFTRSHWEMINADMTALAATRSDMVIVPTADVIRYDGIHPGFGTETGDGYTVLAERYDDLRRLP